MSFDELFNNLDFSDVEYKNMIDNHAFYNKENINTEIQNVDKIELLNGKVTVTLVNGTVVEINKQKEILFLKKIYCKEHLNNEEFFKDINEIPSDLCVAYKNNYWSFKHGLRKRTLDELNEQWNNTNKKIYNCTIKERNPGGFIVDLNCVDCFLSGEHSGFMDLTKFDEHIGKTIEVVVINKSKFYGTYVVSATEACKITQYLDLTKNNIELAVKNSEIANKETNELYYLQTLQEEGRLFPEKEKRLKELTENTFERDILNGFIKNITSKGVFVTIDNNDTIGFLNPNSTMNPLYKYYFDKKYLNIGEPIKVMIAERFKNGKILLDNRDRRCL